MSWKEILKAHCMAKAGEPCDCSECMKKAKCPHCDGNAPKSECICGAMEKAGDKPDYIDLDGDGNKTESMKQAAKDKKGRRRGSLIPKDKKGGRSAFTSKD